MDRTFSEVRREFRHWARDQREADAAGRAKTRAEWTEQMYILYGQHLEAIRAHKRLLGELGRAVRRASPDAAALLKQVERAATHMQLLWGEYCRARVHGGRD
jgi:hypothetical protein